MTVKGYWVDSLGPFITPPRHRLLSDGPLGSPSPRTPYKPCWPVSLQATIGYRITASSSQATHWALLAVVSKRHSLLAVTGMTSSSTTYDRRRLCLPDRSSSAESWDRGYQPLAMTSRHISRNGPIGTSAALPAIDSTRPNPQRGGLAVPAYPIAAVVATPSLVSNTAIYLRKCGPSGAICALTCGNVHCLIEGKINPPYAQRPAETWAEGPKVKTESLRRKCASALVRSTCGNVVLPHKTQRVAEHSFKVRLLGSL